MVRFLCIVFGLYNIFILSKAWATAADFLYQATDVNPGMVNMVLFAIFISFLFAQSICLAMFQKHTIKIQTILCSLDPFMRIIAVGLILSSKKNQSLHIITFFSIITFIVVQVIFIIFDIFVILYLRSKKVKYVFDHAMLWRKQKSINKLAG
jgi:hypothetical protein